MISDRITTALLLNYTTLVDGFRALELPTGSSPPINALLNNIRLTPRILKCDLDRYGFVLLVSSAAPQIA